MTQTLLSDMYDTSFWLLQDLTPFARLPTNDSRNYSFETTLMQI